METGSLETDGAESSLKIVKRRKEKDFEQDYPFVSDLSLCPHVVYYFQIIPACKKVKLKKIQEKMGAQRGCKKRGVKKFQKNLKYFFLKIKK